MTVSRSQPSSDEVQRALDRVRSGSVDAECDIHEYVATLKDRLTEHEANARAYEEIIGKKTYREVADELRSARRALRWIVNSPSAHPANMVKVAVGGLGDSK